MELTQSDYTRPGSKHVVIRKRLAGTIVFIEQNTNIDNPNVWDAPYICVNHEKVTELKHLKSIQAALDMAGKLFEEWSEDTGKEIN